MSHGWVTPNPDGSKARCGGPALCPVCAVEAGSKIVPQPAATGELSAAVEAIASRLLVEVNGGELEHISTIYTLEGQARVILNALATAGFTVRRGWA